MIKKLVYAMVIVMTLACGTQKQKAKEQAESFPVLQLVARDTLLEKEYVSEIQAIRNVEIRSKVNSFLEKIYVDEGQEVKAGQLLFQLNSEPYKVAVEKAVAALKSAEAEAMAAKVEVNRVKVLVEKNVVSKTELQLAEAKLDVAYAKIRQALAEEADARLHLGFTEIRSPFNGVVDRLPLKLGSLIEEGTLLTTVADASQIFAYFNVSENEYLQFMRSKGSDSVTRQSDVALYLADGSRFQHAGRIETIEGQIDQGTGSIAFRARFSNDGKLLKHGASGKISLTSWVDDAILVPQKSVFEIQDKNYVYLVDDKSKVTMRSFTVKARVGQYYLVQQGLKAGDRIVFEGIQRVKEGSTIVAKMVTEGAPQLASK